MRRRPVTRSMFAQAQDLPLFSATPITANLQTFEPEEVGQQPALFERPAVETRPARQASPQFLEWLKSEPFDLLDYERAYAKERITPCPSRPISSPF